MEFKTFAKKLKTVIGGASNTAKFTKTIFEAMMNDSGPELLANIKPNTFKAYFNGNTCIKNVAAIVLANLSDEDEFPSYLEGFGETTAQLLADEFEDDIPGINACNASEKITELFLEILREASGKKKSTPKSATKPEDKTSHDMLEEKILVQGRLWQMLGAQLFQTWEYPQRLMVLTSSLCRKSNPLTNFPIHRRTRQCSRNSRQITTIL